MDITITRRGKGNDVSTEILVPVEIDIDQLANFLSFKLGVRAIYTDTLIHVRGDHSDKDLKYYYNLFRRLD